MVASGMGLDCTDVHQVIHVGSHDDMEFYIQETGRGGRDGNLSLYLHVNNSSYQVTSANRIILMIIINIFVSKLVVYSKSHLQINHYFEKLRIFLS